jgi:hypothetical protein
VVVSVENFDGEGFAIAREQTLDPTARVALDDRLPSEFYHDLTTHADVQDALATLFRVRLTLGSGKTPWTYARLPKIASPPFPHCSLLSTALPPLRSSSLRRSQKLVSAARS